MIERSLGDIGGFENSIDPGTLEAVSVNLAESRLQQDLPGVLGIGTLCFLRFLWPDRPNIPTSIFNTSTYQIVCRASSERSLYLFAFPNVVACPEHTYENLEEQPFH